jgi:L-asparagine transporter-like permease
MEQIDLTKNSKEELMERITNRCAKDLKNYKVVGGFFLILFIYNIIDYFWRPTSSETYGFLVPLVLMIEFFIEGWWSNKLSKCGDAKTLVDTYEKYLRFDKVHAIVAIVVAVLLAGLLFMRTNSNSIWVALLYLALFCCLIVWILYRMKKKDKSITAQEINRLRELLGD